MLNQLTPYDIVYDRDNDSPGAMFLSIIPKPDADCLFVVDKYLDARASRGENVAPVVCAVFGKRREVLTRKARYDTNPRRYAVIYQPADPELAAAAEPIRRANAAKMDKVYEAMLRGEGIAALDAKPDYSHYDGPVYSADSATKAAWEKNIDRLSDKLYGRFDSADGPGWEKTKFFIKLSREDIRGEHDYVKLMYAIAKCPQLMRTELVVFNAEANYVDPDYVVPMDAYALACGEGLAPLVPFKTVWKAYRRERTAVSVIAEIEFERKPVRVSAIYGDMIGADFVLVVISNNQYPVEVDGETVPGVDSREDAKKLTDKLGKAVFKTYDEIV